MSAPANILTGLDLFGSLIDDRRDGELLSEYRSRLGTVASVLTKRDMSDPNWIAHRELELEGRTGKELRLIPGVQDRQLRAEAFGKLLTWKRLESWRGPFRWPEVGAAGRPYYYNDATAVGSGVASPLDLAPYKDFRTGNVFYGPGYCVADGAVWYVAAHLERIRMLLLAGTSETVVIPYQIIANHGHRIDIVDDNTLDFVGSDHTHRMVLNEDGTWTQTSGPTAHELVPINTEGPCFIRCGDDNAARTEDIDNSQTIPIIEQQSMVVRTTDGRHEALVSPYDYFSGSFTIGDSSHVHKVSRVNPTDYYLTAAEAGPDNHTHLIVPASIPTNRFLTPYMTQYESEVYDSSDQTNPFIAYTRVEQGWTVISNPKGFGETLTLAFDTGTIIYPDQSPIRNGYVNGYGPEEPASHAHIVYMSEAAAGANLKTVVRSEDRFSGGVPGTNLTMKINLGSWTASQTLSTGTNAEAAFYFTLPSSGPYSGIISFYIEDVLTDEVAIRVGQFGTSISGYGATPYGLDFGN